jgi:RNA polymerase sigma factor (sigma-70 family)
MPAEAFDTEFVHRRIDRWRAGDRTAADELFRRVAGRLEGLARRMLRQYGSVREQVETMDVHQAAVARLLHSLRRVRPENTRRFLGLAAVQIRRELLDLARRFRVTARRLQRTADTTPESGVVDPPAPTNDGLDTWSRFHAAVEQLPSEEGETVGLVFYHGWTVSVRSAALPKDHGVPWPVAPMSVRHLRSMKPKRIARAGHV